MVKKVNKRKSQGRLPELLFMLACDAVSRDPNTGKESIYGVFERIFMEKIPGVFGKTFFVFAKLKGGSGSHEVTFRALGPDGKTLQGHEPGTVTVKCRPKGTITLNVQIGAILFAKQGVHKFQLQVGQKRLGKPLEIVVERTKKS